MAALNGFTQPVVLISGAGPLLKSERTRRAMYARMGGNMLHTRAHVNYRITVAKAMAAQFVAAAEINWSGPWGKSLSK